MASRWYVLRVANGRENSISEALKKRAKAKRLHRIVKQIVAPTEKVTQIKSGKKSIAERRIYPGYIMVEIEMTEADEIPPKCWALIKETPGVGDFIGHKSRGGENIVPVPMEEHEVKRMLVAIKSEEESPRLKIGFKSGDSVRIKKGPFENFDGYVEEINAAKGTVRVVVTIFGRATPIEIEYWQVELI